MQFVVLFILSPWLFGLPPMLTLVNLIRLFTTTWLKCLSVAVDLFTIGLGIFLLCIVRVGSEFGFLGWFSFLPGNFLPKLCWVLIFLAIAAWVPLRFVPVQYLPHWIAVACIAIICAGFVPCLLFYGHLISAYPLSFGDMAPYFFLPPLNCILIGAKAIRDYVQEKAVRK